MATKDNVIEAGMTALVTGASSGIGEQFSSHQPTLIPGAANRLLASGYRIMPRGAMAHMAERTVRSG